MNVVVDEAAEVYVKESKPRRELGTQPGPWLRDSFLNIAWSCTTGRIMLKGDNITLIQQAS